ncbi:MAG: DUF354 domain-containing protein [Candidatus Marinimicrobia bacterium]|nr:DUF354 domain-containing protein [Candidatus Neomarinimicrobiota bacterium]
MKIFIDIGHPAHVHYFRNAISIFKSNGHEVLVTTRKKEVTIELLEYYKIPYIYIGKNYQTFIGKFFSILRNDFLILIAAYKFKPDIFLSFLLPFPAHVGFLLNKPVIGFGDTENAKLSLKLTKLFTDCILTPSCYMDDLGEKQVRFDGYMELCYLHPNYFVPNPKVLDFLNLDIKDKYIILRFVSWNANHDIGHKGISIEMKKKIVHTLSKYAKVFISSENELPHDLKDYQIIIPPEMMHDGIAFSSLLYGESSTMASESACLGTPAIFHDDYGRGYTNEEEKIYNLVFNYSESAEDQEKSLSKAIAILEGDDSAVKFEEKREKMLSEKIDVTSFMVWFVENYPQSYRIMKENPNYQYNFK